MHISIHVSVSTLLLHEYKWYKLVYRQLNSSIFKYTWNKISICSHNGTRTRTPTVVRYKYCEWILIEMLLVPFGVWFPRDYQQSCIERLSRQTKIDSYHWEDCERRHPRHTKQCRLVSSVLSRADRTNWLPGAEVLCCCRKIHICHTARTFTSADALGSPWSADRVLLGYRSCQDVHYRQSVLQVPVVLRYK